MIVRLRTSRAARLIALGLAGGVLVVAAAFAVRRWAGPRPTVVTPQSPAVPARKIQATLFYLSPDGTRLVPVEREVPFSEGTAEQAKRIVEAQVAPPPPDAVTAIPSGTTLRALYVLKDGQAYVDLTREAATAHPGGTLNEILTVYTIVEALTTNLPAITSVHLLVDGREVETLAGHVDLRRPLRPNTLWVHHDTR